MVEGGFLVSSTSASCLGQTVPGAVPGKMRDELEAARLGLVLPMSIRTGPAPGVNCRDRMQTSCGRPVRLTPCGAKSMGCFNLPYALASTPLEKLSFAKL